MLTWCYFLMFKILAVICQKKVVSSFARCCCCFFSSHTWSLVIFFSVGILSSTFVSFLDGVRALWFVFLLYILSFLFFLRFLFFAVIIKLLSFLSGWTNRTKASSSFPFVVVIFFFLFFISMCLLVILANTRFLADKHTHIWNFVRSTRFLFRRW